ncbi:MAG: MATE family efflux transporter, partial [Clostridiaceae bacterium]|nr:MATE family efflux transporter [Clostridiaceae bacterium]
LGGNLAVSAMTIIQSVLMFTIMPVIGVAQGAQPIIGYNYGAGNFARVRKAYFAAVGFASVISVSIAVFVALKTSLVASLFSNDAQQIALATVGMRKSFLLLPAAGFVVISSHYYQNIGRSVISLVLTVLRQALFLIPLYFILSHFWGLDGFFYSMPVSDALSLVLAVILIVIELKTLGRKIAQKNLSPGV